MALIGLAVPLQAQETPAPKPAAVASTIPSFEFMGKKYTLGDVVRNKSSAHNKYYTPGERPKSWYQHISISIYPGQTDIRKVMEAMLGIYKKGNHEIEVGKLSTPRIVSFYAYEKSAIHHQFNIHCLHNGTNGKGVVVRSYSIKSEPKDEAAFRARTANAKKAYLSKLASIKLPKFTLKELSKPAPAQDNKLPALNSIIEKVTDIQGKGKQLSVDEEFAKKNGAKPGGHRSFSIVVPDSELGKAMINARPKIKDMVRLTLVGKGDKMLESIRFTGITIGTNDPMPKRLQRAASLVEKQMVPKFFAGRKNAKIGMRYRTKVGPYEAACLLGRFTAEDGTMLYIKFVAILDEKNPAGTLAIMLLNPTGDKPLNIKKRLQDGFAQRVLHSVRLK